MVLRITAVAANYSARGPLAAIANPRQSMFHQPCPSRVKPCRSPKQLEIRMPITRSSRCLPIEEGRVTLNLLVGADGRVAFVQVLMGSGSPRLDQTTAELARSRWEFQPHTERWSAGLGSAPSPK